MRQTSSKTRGVLFGKIADDALAYADEHKRSAKDDHSRRR